MPEPPKLSGRGVVKAFGRDGWQLVRQKGSHMILVKEGCMATLSVPDHREIAPGTLRRAFRCVLPMNPSPATATRIDNHPNRTATARKRYHDHSRHWSWQAEAPAH